MKEERDNKNRVMDNSLKKLSIDNRLKRIVDKYKNKKPSKEYIKNIKSQSWYQVECIRCKMSNRKWLEEERDAYRRPIRMDEIVNKTGLKIFYFCKNCNVSWKG